MDGERFLSARWMTLQWWITQSPGAISTATSAALSAAVYLPAAEYKRLYPYCMRHTS